MEIDVLLGLEFPNDAAALSELPEPASTSLSRATEAQLATAAVHFRRQLQRLLQSDEWTLEDGVLCKSADGKSLKANYWELVRALGTYYGYCIYRYARDCSPLKIAEMVSEHRLSSVSDDPTDRSPAEVMTKLSKLSASALLQSHDVATLGLLESAAIDLMGFQPGELLQKYDADLKAIEAFQEMHGDLTESAKQAHELASALLGFALEYRAAIVQKRNKARQAESKDSLVGVSLNELLLLSTRDQIAIDKYGIKHVERVFEQQLALIFQSFGFTVVPARPGDASADLVCIARSERFSFLVDAKSSRKPYALPKADQRAIRDYVADFSTTLRDLPPLGFVLVVSGSIASTVPAKLEALEEVAGVPMRFLSARLVAQLRQGVPGPVLPEQFRTSVVRADPELGKSLVSEMKSGMEEITAAYSRFVASLKSIADSQGE